jgi:hypothetical protein
MFWKVTIIRQRKKKERATPVFPSHERFVTDTSGDKQTANIFSSLTISSTNRPVENRTHSAISLAKVSASALQTT